MSVTAGILVAVSAQFATGAFNHKQSSKQMKKLQALQQEYEEALQTDGFERAWDKYNQLCALQKEVEKELHQRRIDNIEQSFNRYLDITAYSQALKNWPLRVLPFVMKDESMFSNGSVDTNNKIALHCLLTRGNDDNFNKAVFRELEVRLSQHFNLFWGAASSHPILFYSGAWKELHDAGAVVDNLYNQLEQLPAIVISPWIDENNEFYFKVSVWGIPNVEMRNTIYKPEGVTFQFKQKQAEYSKKEIQQILNEIDPVLTAFIGYIADQYYWRYNNAAPLLPKLIKAEMVALPANISVEFKQQYIDLLENYISDADSMILHPELSLGLCKSIDNEISKKEYLQKVFIVYCKRYSKDIFSMAEALELNSFTKIDLPFLKKFIGTYEYDDFRNEIENIIEFLLPLDFDYSILDMTNIDKLKLLADAGNATAMFRLGEIYEYSIGVSFDEDKSQKYYEGAKSNVLFVIYKQVQKLLSDNSCNLSDLQIRALEKLYTIGVTQAILYTAILRYYSLCKYEDKYPLEILDSIEFANHPFSYYWGAMLIRKDYSKEYVTNYIDLMAKSASLGYLKAIKCLSEDYLEGIYLPENALKHIEYCKMATSQFDLDSIVDLGVCYASGYGVLKSKQKSIELLKLASEMGSEEASTFLKKVTN